MSKSTATLIAAMHTAAGSHGKYVLAWHTLTQTDDELRAAIRAVFGKRMPTAQKLGQWLSEHIGAQGDYFLEGKHSLKRKAWAYRVVTLAEVAEREHKRAEEEAALRAQHEAQQTAIRAAQKAQEEARRAALSPAVEYETTTRVASDGRIIQERVVGRDGEPVRKYTEAPKPAAPEKPAELAHVVEQSHFAPWIGINSSGTPVLKRQPSRTELAAKHRSMQSDFRPQTPSWQNAITPQKGNFNL